MGSSGGGPQTVTNRTEIPAWLEDVTKENIKIADEISKRPYVPYGGEMVAGFSPEQERAFGYAQEGVGMFAPAYDAAMGGASRTMGFTPQQVQAGNFLTGDINAYMNPYVENVEKAALGRLEGATRQAVNRIGDQAVSARAFGGSRQGIAEGVALGEGARSAGELSAGLRSQAFQQAAALQQADQQRALQAALANQQAGLSGAGLNLQASGQLANLAGAAQASRGADVGLLESMGRQRQALSQQQLDEAYARFMEERNYPIENLNLRLAATSSTPYGGTQTQTRTGGASGSNFLSGLGTAASVASSLATIASL